MIQQLKEIIPETRVHILHRITCKKVFVSDIGYCNGRYFAYLWCDEPKRFNTRKELFQYIRNNI